MPMMARALPANELCQERGMFLIAERKEIKGMLSAMLCIVLVCGVLAGTEPELFYLSTSNNVTIECPMAEVGSSGEVDGVLYTKRDRLGLLALIHANPHDQEIQRTCTSGITNMSSLFQGQATFNQDIGSWDTSLVTDMTAMFQNASTFNQDLSIWCVTLIDEEPTKFKEGATSFAIVFGSPVWGTCPTAYFCFPQTSIVIKDTIGAVPMTELQVGDKILVEARGGSLVYEDVYMIPHGELGRVAVFMKICTKSQKCVLLSPDHWIPTQAKKGVAPTALKESKKVKIGDKVKVLAGNGSMVWEYVSSVDAEYATGLYSPYTLSGLLVVDGILVSSHSSWILDHMLERMNVPCAAGYQTLFGSIRSVYRMLGARHFARILHPIIKLVAAIHIRDTPYNIEPSSEL